jgi:transposase
MRSIALDVHRDFCEVAIKQGAELRSAGRIKTTVAELELFAQSLAKDDRVALEATGPANAIARILEPHVGRVVIANTRRVRAIAEAKVKSDKVDAATLCELLDAGFLPAVWSPDEQTRGLRGLLGRRDRLVRSRTRAKNAVHAALGRELKGRPPRSDLFGRAGRAWLGRLELPAHERQIVASCLREVDFLSQEIAALESELARLALSSEQVKRLMTVPGVSLVSAATFVAVVGDIHPLRDTQAAGRLCRARPQGAPVRRGQGAARADLEAGLGPDAPHALRGRLDRGAHAGPLARLLSAPAGAARGPDRARRDRAQALCAVLASAHARAGLRVRAAVAHSPQAAPARADGRRSAPPGPALWIEGEQARAAPRARALRAGRAGIPPTGRRLAAAAEQERCGRDTGTRIFKGRLAASSAAGKQSQALRFSSSSPAPKQPSQRRSTQSRAT